MVLALAGDSTMTRFPPAPALRAAGGGAPFFLAATLAAALATGFRLAGFSAGALSSAAMLSFFFKLETDGQSSGRDAARTTLPAPRPRARPGPDPAKARPGGPPRRRGEARDPRP